jgi:alpha-L-rhamnosidase
MRTLWTVVCFLLPAATAVAGVEPAALRCEYRVDPLGIDVAEPRLSWIVESAERGQRQTAYRVLVASSAEKLASGEADLWDSGRVASDQTIHVVYAGRLLASRMACYWKVQVWDAQGRASPWSRPAAWTMGLLARSDWQAQWIADSKPAAMLRREFQVGGPVRRATIYATGLGLYELRLNGRRVGNQLLAPEWTRYGKRIQYQTYDVTSLVRPGANAIGAILGEGWYAGPMMLKPAMSNPVFRLLLRMEIQRADGQVETIVSDPSWQATDEGPIRRSGIYFGETYDATREQPGWDLPGFRAAAWRPVRAVELDRQAVLCAQKNEPIRVVKELKPVKVSEPRPGQYVFDLGQNMVGWCRLKVRGPAGTKLTLRHGEMLNDDGTLYTANLRGAAQVNEYTLAGRGEEVFEPHFTYHGFRYVELTGLPTRPAADAILGRVFCSSSPEAGRLECSSAMLNRLVQNIAWTQQANLMSAPTDCPQRTEREGWMGDIQAFSQTAIYNRDMAAFFTKWIQDIRDSQAGDGRYPDIAPHVTDPDAMFSGVPAWGDAGTIVPWRMYQNYADVRLLGEHFDSACRWIEFIRQKNPDLLWRNSRGNDYGDWLNGDTLVLKDYPHGQNEVPKEVLATAFFAHSTQLVAKMAKVLGRADAAKYAKLHQEIRAAFNRAYVASDGKIKGDTQAGYALALAFDLLDEPLRPRTVEHLLAAIARYKGHLSTGIQSTHHAMLELSRNGRHDEACRLLCLDSVPSWGYMVNQGATTIWERWDGYVRGRGFQDPGMNSFNHWAFGSVGQWVWQDLAGIQPDDESPGYKHFTIRPRPGAGVTWLGSRYDSIRGPIESRWKLEGDRFALDATVPANTTATIYVPAGSADAVTEGGVPLARVRGVKLLRVQDGAAVLEVESGRYAFRSIVGSLAVIAAPPTKCEPAADYAALAYRNETWYGSTFWSGPDWTRVGRDWQHPGEQTPSVRAFYAPRDGRLSVAGRVYKAHADGDGVRLAIRHGDETVWQAEIEGKDQQGVEPKLTLDVLRGDKIRFVVQKRGTIFCDTTHWDPVITYADGQRFRASQGFSTTRQGENGWYYQMEKAASTVRQGEPGWPYRKGMTLEAMIRADWRREDRIEETPPSYAAAARRQLDLARQLLDDLRAASSDAGRRWDEESKQLTRLSGASAAGDGSLEGCKRFYLEVRRLKRRIALANPLLRFGKLLFCKRVPTSYSHLVMQYFGWRARPGGGLCVLENPGRSLACRDILDGRLEDGNVLEPRLSYDARRIVFSFVRCSGKSPDPERLANDIDEDFYHIWEVGVDGSGLRQLTFGPYDDVMPTCLPDGGIAFCSTRRKGYARCFGGQFSPRWHVYTLHRMDAGGRNLRPLSFHDTNEWFPSVSRDGLILYARWDYIDRDAVTHQNLWATRPDGTNPLAVWGNASPTPNCSFQAQPIPGSRKIIFTASAHHSTTGGSIAVVDPAVSDNSQAAITRITPGIPFPEAEGNQIGEYYASPWPLSEKYYLVSYSPVPLVWEPGANPANALGIYLLDIFGNRELIYRDLQIGSTNPCPLAPRAAPPALPSLLPPDASPAGVMVLADVCQGLGNVPRGSIKQLRIVQVFPKSTPVANSPPIGIAGEENGRAILGTVPVEPDGSAYFTVPAGKGLLFQALDQDGLAYQTMRSLTYLQPGERTACVGCHENRRSAPAAKDVLALLRAPSPIEPGELGGEPFSYVRVVQPVLDEHCVSCHGDRRTEGGLDLRGTPRQGFTQSYCALCGDGQSPKNTRSPQPAEPLVPRFPARNQIQTTPPGGRYGARGSRLIKLLAAGHENVRLGPAELRRLAAWIDLNAIFYGVNRPEDQNRQLRGESIAMPEIQ